MSDSEHMIDAIVGGVWHLERWNEVADRLFSASIALIFCAPDHPAREDIEFLSQIGAMRARS
ncbi:hypothetical protein [Thiocapsa sp. UBA6158]|jgi:hypothetical protein|uniref:hypothetical protein n=1 Tax=Thiocapsa sp. UBA6158 TaxID=1947692 RepID=UPI0025FF4D2F|nr:hypothetical protein [Thiocapsa sp. UBA6158]